MRREAFGKWGRLLALVALCAGGPWAPNSAAAQAQPKAQGQGQGLTALARYEAAGSHLRQTEGQGLDLQLSIGQSVPWRVRVLDAPPRLVLDAREIDWRGVERLFAQVPQITDSRAGVLRAGWSRLVLTLAAPMVVQQADMRISPEGGQALIRLALAPTDAESFAQAAARPEPRDWQLPEPAHMPPPLVRGTGPVVVVLDPGHGGLDPGAESGKYSEADLMLTFARELKDLLVRDGAFKVVMTRDEDVFVPLERRISIAHLAQAQVMLSLHADSLPEGEAQGATIYTLADEAVDAAAVTLAERHARDDLLAGVDLTAHDDLVATVLMDMARRETTPRTERLARHLAAAMQSGELRMHRHPLQRGGFSVLKSPDVPSALIELGFMSSSRDLNRLIDPAWRARMAEAVRVGLLNWVSEEHLLTGLRRATP